MVHQNAPRRSTRGDGLLTWVPGRPSGKVHRVMVPVHRLDAVKRLINRAIEVQISKQPLDKAGAISRRLASCARVQCLPGSLSIVKLEGSLRFPGGYCAVCIRRMVPRERKFRTGSRERAEHKTPATRTPKYGDCAKMILLEQGDQRPWRGTRGFASDAL